MGDCLQNMMVKVGEAEVDVFNVCTPPKKEANCELLRKKMAVCV